MAKRESPPAKRHSNDKSNQGGGRASPRNPRDSSPDGRRAQSQRPPGNLFWLFGHHAVLAALSNRKRRIHRLLMTHDTAKNLAESIEPLRARANFPREEIVDRPDLDLALPPSAVHQGIAALVEPLPGHTIENVISWAEPRTNAVIIVLDQVTDPHNVGAILRSAAAFGALAVVVPDRHSPDETGTLAKSASGALECMPLIRVINVVRTIEDLKKAGFWIAGMAGEATQTLAEQKLTGKVVLVMGAEGEGLRRLTREHCDYLVKLPMTGLVESLNVSNAAAIALYELVRDTPQS